ncbi:MAG: SusC/RagA family TonB-linked outer membrane protein [Prevotellaceae bacterium]|jgi:TonB-linked SusC/RagA family outer membrane protein|nr:SusC/RagA family TonB-linked outer membrane protein [Prevotellaceae bacterium]
MKKIILQMLLVIASVGFAQAQTRITGKVTDSEGKPLDIVSISVKEVPTAGTLTDADGNYTINVPSGGLTLVFSYIGYITQEVAIGTRSIMDIILESDAESLTESIVVAFGTTTKAAFTGSAAVIKSEELAKRVTSNVTNALVGSIPGLQMRGSSGEPGAGNASINIRGIASMYSSTDPLIIVDGAPYSSSLTNIPTGDIESVSVLKDAASAALYGARGAAGVIIVTTKKGNTRNAVVSADIKVGVSSRSIQEYDVITDPAQYYEAYYSQIYNYYYYGQGYDAVSANLSANTRTISNLGYNVYTVPDGELLIGANGRLNPNAKLGRKHLYNGTEYYMQPDNWTDLAYRNALRHEYNVSINGGSENSSFYASIGYLNEDGVIEYSGYDRISARLKTDYQANKWLKLGGNVAYVHSNQKSNPNLGTDEGSTNLMYYTSMIAPIYPVYIRVIDENGNVVIKQDEYGHDAYDYGVAVTNYGVTRPFMQTGNPLGSNRYNEVSTEVNQLNANFTADFTITSYLKANITSTVIWGQSHYSDYQNSFYGPKAGVNGELTKSFSSTMRTNNVQTLTYFKDFGKHNVNVMMGHEYYNTTTKYLDAIAQGGFSPDIKEINAFANRPDSHSYTTEYNVEGYFGSAQYNYAQKYFASFSYRRDASSRFHKDHWWGNFWSAGGAWILSKEPFLEDLNWIDMLKIKASIGQQGNDNIGNWAYIDLFSLSKTSETTMSPSFSRIGNSNITWETTTNINTGVEFAFWGNRLTGNIDLYTKKVTDLLFWLSIPESAGTRGYYNNIGDVRNSGVELALTGAVVRTNKIDWNLSVNLSHNKTKILKLPESKIIVNGGFMETSTGGLSMWYEVGGPLYNIARVKYAGINEEGMATYWVDDTLNGSSAKPGKEYSRTTTNPNEASRYAMGSTLPKVFGGFSTALRIGNFDASATFDFQLGGRVYDYRYQRLMTPIESVNSAGSTFHKDYAKSWNPANNTSSNIPRWQYGDQYSAAASDRFLTSASYLNFQSFTVGYTFPQNLIKYISKIRIYVAGENLIFWSARKGLDPRYAYDGNESVNVYSPIRNISGGIQLTF